MTVKASQGEESKSGLHDLAMTEPEKIGEKAETESTTSSMEEEENESPKSVQSWGRKRKEEVVKKLHNQVLKIREEDSNIGQDIGEKDKVHGGYTTNPVDLVFFTRPILPCSPLSGKTTSATTTVKALH
ncbi:hypothetical protein CFOL_v3_15830 [Cephalotus follicularis]|uniref:Uncharacterized protein n=1 Tax=Cephalotus follicularis TaxID=3775 RepID=A0A1Q3BWS6_CEPFO|nr:hypothetical protein CFOL_v3_15830 [Cephalotus follicularis]